jgi:hypothetical protein
LLKHYQREKYGVKTTFFRLAAACILTMSMGSASFGQESETDTMNVLDFSVKLAKQLGIGDGIPQEPELQQVLEVFPEDLGDILKVYHPEEPVTRILAVQVFSFFLEPEEVDRLLNAGDMEDPLSREVIMELFEQCTYEGDVLTYIEPAGHEFSEDLETRQSEIYQDSVS